jgi:hypothetical protein
MKVPQRRNFSVVTVCRDYGLNFNLDKCAVMKVSQKTREGRSLDNIKCNNYEIKKCGEL